MAFFNKKYLMSQLHQIAFNNYNEFSSLLMQKYNLPVPQTQDELVTAVDFGTREFGQEFMADVFNIQMQKNIVEQSEVAYKSQLDSSNKEQLKDELIRLNVKLKQAQDLQMREYMLDKIAYVQKLIIQKNEETPGNSTAQIHKNNQLLLLGIAAVVLMLLGSKIFKQ